MSSQKAIVEDFVQGRESHSQYMPIVLGILKDNNQDVWRDHGQMNNHDTCTCEETTESEHECYLGNMKLWNLKQIFANLIILYLKIELNLVWFLGLLLLCNGGGICD